MSDSEPKSNGKRTRSSDASHRRAKSKHDQCVFDWLHRALHSCEAFNWTLSNMLKAKGDKETRVPDWPCYPSEWPTAWPTEIEEVKKHLSLVPATFPPANLFYDATERSFIETKDFDLMLRALFAEYMRAIVQVHDAFDRDDVAQALCDQSHATYCQGLLRGYLRAFTDADLVTATRASLNKTRAFNREESMKWRARLLKEKEPSIKHKDIAARLADGTDITSKSGFARGLGASSGIRKSLQTADFENYRAPWESKPIDGRLIGFCCEKHTRLFKRKG